MLVEGEAREPLKSLPAPRFGEFRSIRKCDFVDLILIHGISEASEYKQYIIPKNRRLDLTFFFLFPPEYKWKQVNMEQNPTIPLSKFLGYTESIVLFATKIAGK